MKQNEQNTTSYSFDENDWDRAAYTDIEKFIYGCLTQAGADHKSADAVARSLVTTSLRGVDSHGIRLLPHYIKTLQGGRINGKPNLTFQSLAASTGTVDADHGFGQVAGYRAIDEAMAIADKNGIGAVTVINSSHFGAAGCYSLAAAEQGYLSIAICNSDKFVVAHDGIEPFHGTNPISFAAPIIGEKPYLFDMATSSIPWNRVLQYGLIDRPLPSDVAIDDQGNVTTDANQTNALLPLGGAEFGYKGAGLAGMCDVLSAVLTGMSLSHAMYNFTGPDFSKHRHLGQFFIVMKPEAFIPTEMFDAQLKTYLHDLRNQPAKEGARVLAPGDREWAVEEQRLKQGIPIDQAVWQIFSQLAKSLDVAPLQPVSGSVK